jgi:hypothetical protein
LRPPDLGRSFRFGRCVTCTGRAGSANGRFGPWVGGRALSKARFEEDSVSCCRHLRIRCNSTADAFCNQGLVGHTNLQAHRSSRGHGDPKVVATEPALAATCQAGGRSSRNLIRRDGPEHLPLGSAGLAIHIDDAGHPDRCGCLRPCAVVAPRTVHSSATTGESCPGAST